MSDAGIVVMEVEFVMQWASAGYIFDPISTFLIQHWILGWEDVLMMNNDRWSRPVFTVRDYINLNGSQCG